MPRFTRIVYTQHARQRMEERRITHEDVDLTPHTGEGRPGRQDTWLYERGRYRVAVRDVDGAALVLTVIRLRGKR